MTPLWWGENEAGRLHTTFLFANFFVIEGEEEILLIRIVRENEEVTTARDI